METLKYAIEHPEFIIKRSAQIHKHLTRAHKLVNDTFGKTSALKIKSCDEHGAYIAFELDDSLFGNVVTINNKVFTINDARDVCIYLLDKYGVGLTPVDPRDNLPNTVRMFVDLNEADVNEGVKRFINGMKELVRISKDPSHRVIQKLTPGL